MSGAFLYLTLCTIRNRIRVRLRRLREPRYLLGLVVALLYFRYLVFRPRSRQPGRPDANPPPDIGQYLRCGRSHWRRRTAAFRGTGLAVPQDGPSRADLLAGGSARSVHRPDLATSADSLQDPPLAARRHHRQRDCDLLLPIGQLIGGLDVLRRHADCDGDRSTSTSLACRCAVKVSLRMGRAASGGSGCRSLSCSPRSRSWPSPSSRSGAGWRD